MSFDEQVRELLGARVRAWLDEEIGRCPYCGTEMRRTGTGPRGLDHRDRLGCLTCVRAPTGRECVICWRPIRRHERHEQSYIKPGAWAHKQCVDDHHDRRRKG